MKKKILFILAVMLMTTSTMAQKVVLNYINGDIFDVDISLLESITFEDIHEWVDLGLPSGTLWATCNFGANTPEEYGDYWTRSLSTKYNYFAYDMDGSPNGLWDDGFKRCGGQVVRPVRKQKHVEE